MMTPKDTPNWIGKTINFNPTKGTKDNRGNLGVGQVSPENTHTDNYTNGTCYV